MPNGNPLAGEVWETTDPTGRVVRGVVADITSTIVTLVSFTGNRFRLPPRGLTSSWRFSQAPPPTALRCSRRGCMHAGILRFARGSNVEWVCPRHLPVGIQASLTTESIGSPRPPAPVTPSPAIQINPPIEDPRCLGCNNTDPVEDTRVALPPDVSLWICTRCSERWCLIGQPSTVVSSYDSHTAILDTLNAVRVALSVENYHIQEISTSGTYYGLFEAEVARQVSEVSGDRPRVDSPGMVVYAGLPIRNSFTFRADNPMLTLMRLQLGGGPELRPGRPLPRDMEERLSQLQQAVPGLPTPPGVFTEPVAVRPANTVSMYASGRETFSMALTRVSPADPTELLAEMHSTPFVSKGTRWSNRSNGEIVEVTELGRSTDRGDTVVHFKRISDDLEAGVVLMQLDFVTLYKPMDEPAAMAKLREESIVEVLKDEEWEHIDSGETGVIDAVDTKRNLVVIIGKDTKRRTVRMIEFVNNKWRKIVRKTAYARLLEDDD
jgi:hypothetical protein